MSYSLIKTVTTPFNLGAIHRGIRDIRVSALRKNISNYLKHEHAIWKQNKEDIILPTNMYLELTTYCARRCIDCYMPENVRKDKKVISMNLLERTVEKGKSLGIRFYTFIGGETISDNTVPIIENLAQQYSQFSFITCTNGDYIASKTDKLDKLILMDNFTVALSVDGFALTNELLRGSKSFKNFIVSSDYLKSRRSLFGAVAALRPQNYEEATSEEFISMLIEQGAMHFSCAFTDKMTPEMRKSALDRIDSLRDKPIFFYTSLFGHSGESSRKMMVREISINKNGEVLSQRKEREVIGSVDDLEQMLADPRWTKRFTEQINI